ncbi:hypothetical protein C8F04DRAFT_295559 [Mycena alexandri]|uniref:F-box domain-containing protein n=1 Tax=Mycena alexandri TaxID=1745969 RepID=A0AAD6T879_9AGAR|nr:hypothetical protein C8F04DRAFT_295559 [Mycena alexandri]
MDTRVVTGILRLPNEILLEILQQLDASDPGIFALSTFSKRLHYLALPVYLASHGIVDAPELASQDCLTLAPSQLHVLRALGTALFIPSLKRIHCSFSLSSARRGYSPREMDVFLHHIRSLAGFLSILERVDEVTLDFKGCNFWVISETLDVLERYTSAISTLLNVILEKQCKTLDVEGGMFVVHPSQFQTVARPPMNKHHSFILAVGRRLGSAFMGNGESSGKPQTNLAAFSIRSSMLLLHPCNSWTVAALNSASNIVSLSVTHVDIPERSWDELLSGLHAPTLKHLSLNLSCRLRAATIDEFLGRHPFISTLDLGRDLLLEGDVLSKDHIRHLINLSATPNYVRFLMADKRAPAVPYVRVLVKVAPHAPFNVAHINHALDRCDALRLDSVHLTLVVTVEYASSHWTGFFPDEVPSETADRVDTLRYARALELIATHPSDAFAPLALRWLPSFTALQSVSFSGCLHKHLDAMHFVARVKQACREIRSVTLDGETYSTREFP